MAEEVKKKRGRKPGSGKKQEKKVSEAKKTKLLTDAKPDQYFILANGQKIKNVKELADVFDRIEDHIFNHHVTPDRNDFATWIHDIFQDLDLAKEIAGLKDKKHIQFTLYKHISHKACK